MASGHYARRFLLSTRPLTSHGLGPTSVGMGSCSPSLARARRRTAHGELPRAAKPRARASHPFVERFSSAYARNPVRGQLAFQTGVTLIKQQHSVHLMVRPRTQWTSVPPETQAEIKLQAPDQSTVCNAWKADSKGPQFSFSTNPRCRHQEGRIPPATAALSPIRACGCRVSPSPVP